MVSNQLVGLRLVRVRSADGRTHVGLLGADELRILATEDVIAVLESDQPVAKVVHVTTADPATCAPPDPWKLLVPLVAPETWAAGVTYERSRDARLRESEVADVYDLVYEAERG
jgi:2-dehydro-3-deoxy-D-arabinonate dehydratase